MKNPPRPQTVVELRRQISEQDVRRAAITERLALICAERAKLGSVAAAPLLDDDERAARSHALSILAGIAVEIDLPPQVTEERALYRERRGIDIALKVLQEKLEAANEAAALKWWKTAEPQWDGLMREAVRLRVRLAEMDRRAESMFHGIDFTQLPPMKLGQFRGQIAETPLHILIAAAIEDGVISRTEVQEIQNAK